MDKIYTVKQVAEYMTVHQGTVRRWLESGLLKGFKVNGQWRVNETDLKRFMLGDE